MHFSLPFRTAMISFVFLSACGGKKQPPARAANQPTVVDVLVAESSVINNSIEVNGTVLPNEYVELHPEISGRLTYLNVPEGGAVQEGSLLARINDAELQAQMSKLKVQLELAEKTEERLQQLLNIQGLNQADYDAALNQVNGLKADMAFIQAQIDKTYIKAPFSGIVGLRQVSPGAYITPATIIATIQQVNKIKIDFTLPEVYGNIIKKGAVVEVLVDGSNKEKSKAIVIASEPLADINTRNIKVRALLQNGNANPGAFVKVFIPAGSAKNSVLVPSNAIIPDAKNDKVVLVKNNKAAFVDIETGLRQEGSVEIKKGIAIGDTIVVSGVLFARPGAPLQIGVVRKLEEPVGH